MNREAFFQRVRAAVQSAQRYKVRTRSDIPAGAGYAGGGDDLPQRLASEITAVGGFAYPVADMAAARDAVAGLLRERGVQSALCWEHPVLDQLGVAGLLAEQDIALIDRETIGTLPFESQRAAMLAAGVGLTSCDWAIAETGSLVVMSRPGQERLASLLPPVHIAVVTAAQVLPDLFDLFARLETAGLDNLPSNLTLITGPSKTGDIELQLTTGVHGPGQWHVVIVRTTP